MNVRRTTKLREEFAVLSVVGVSSEPPSVPTQVVHAQAAKKRQDEGCYSRAEILSELPPVVHAVPPLVVQSVPPRVVQSASLPVVQ